MPQLSMTPTVEPVADVVDAAALAQLAAQIKEAVNSVEQQARLAVQHALDAGKLLLQAKEQVEHGQWEAWLAVNCEIAPRTARAYMLLAKKFAELPAEERQRVADSPLRQALRAIATDPEAPPPAARPATHDDRQRVIVAFNAGFHALRSAAKRIQKGELKGAQATALRKKLVAALDALDRITQVATPKSEPENGESKPKFQQPQNEFLLVRQALSTNWGFWFLSTA